MKVVGHLVFTMVMVCGTTSLHAGPLLNQGTWETTLKARDLSGNAVALNDASAAFFYDTTLNVTWLANMNLNGGPMNWGSAVAWADTLTAGGFTDWRLPTIIDSGPAGCDWSYDGGTDCGYTVQTQVGGAYSEWAHLFYVTLGNVGVCLPGGGTPNLCEGPPPSNYGLSNTAYFQDMQTYIYWSGTEYVSQGSGDAWGFYTGLGAQREYEVSRNTVFAVAVRSGDVLRVDGTVPEPGSLALLIAAGGALAWSQRCRRCDSARRAH